MKKCVIGYAVVILTTLILTEFFRLSRMCSCVIGMAGMVLLPLNFRICRKRKEMAERYDEINVYMELLLCSYKRCARLKSALLDCRSVFAADSRMGSAIAEALHVLESGECSDKESMAEASLKKISSIYDCSRMKLVHRIICRAEYKGSDVTEAIDVMLADFEMWKRRFVQYQKGKQSAGRECIISVVLALMLCFVSRILIPENFLMLVEETAIYQASTTVVICAFLFVITLIMFFVGHTEWERKEQKKQIREVERQFPYWLLAVTVYLKNDSLYHALENAREEVSGIFREETDRLIDEIYQNPASIEPFTNFFKNIPLSELQTGMKLLYSVNFNGSSETSRQIQFLVEQSQLVMNQSESRYYQAKLAVFRMLRQVPMMFAGGKAVLDVLTFFMIMGSQISFLNGG